MLVASLNPEFFSSLLEPVRYAPDMWSAIAHADGLQLLAAPHREGMAGMNLAVPGSFFSRHRDSGWQENLLTGVVHATGENRMMALRTIKPVSVPLDKPLVLAVGRDMAAMYANWHREARLQGALWGLIGLLAMTGLYAYQRRQGQNLRRAEAARAALAESEDRLRKAVQWAPLPMLIHAEDGQILLVNDVWSEISGYTQADLPTIARWVELAFGPRAALMQQTISQVYRPEGRSEVGDFLIRTKDGRTLTWHFSGAPLGIGADGRRLGISVAVDVTQRRQAEDEIRSLNETLETPGE